MSLDVSLVHPRYTEHECIYCGSNYKEKKELYTNNITHNLGKMAKKAGIYTPLWKPEEVRVIVALDLIGYLEKGLDNLKKDAKYFKQFDAENGWGKYEDFVFFVEDYLKACKKNPEALIEISR